MNRFIRIILSVLFIGFLIPTNAFAAFGLISQKLTPPTPGPNQEVTIQLNSYNVNLNAAKIIWYIDGEAQKEGTAETSFVTRTGDFGEKKVVDVVIFAQDGTRFDKQIVLAPAEVDILWEALTYTPPFYKGKALPTYKSLVKVSALARFNTETSDPAAYYYKWTLDRNKGVGEALGKNSTVVAAAWPDSHVNVAVETSLPGTDWKGAKNLNIDSVNPQVVFYEQAPLLGIRFAQALTSGLVATGNEFTIQAAPYFFSLDNYKNGELVYEWTANRNRVLPTLDPLKLILTKSSKAAENFIVSLSVQNAKRVIQEGRGQTTVSFNAEE